MSVIAVVGWIVVLRAVALAADATTPGMWDLADPTLAVPAIPARATPAAPLIERPAPGGGGIVDLGDRFMTGTIATVEPDGTVRLHCERLGAPAEAAR